MQKILIAFSLVLVLHVKGKGAIADTARADAEISNATVYFGYGAELTHQSKIKVNSDTKVIVISQLGTNVDLNSLQISVPEDVALLSHRYNYFTPPVPVNIKPDVVIAKEDSIETIQKEISRTDNLIAIDQEILTKRTINKLILIYC